MSEAIAMLPGGGAVVPTILASGAAGFKALGLDLKEIGQFADEEIAGLAVLVAQEAAKPKIEAGTVMLKGGLPFVPERVRRNVLGLVMQ